MTIASLGKYEFTSSDALEKYKGKLLIYINWEKHRMFSRPFVLAVDPKTLFQNIVQGPLTECFSYHPDFAQIDWSQVIWQNSNTVFQPIFERSIEENGIGHKDLIRFTTPNLNGIAGSGY